MSEYTVIGVWVEDEPIPVGVVAGRHQVTGGQTEEAEAEFPQGIWGICVEADDSDGAETKAVAAIREIDRR